MLIPIGTEDVAITVEKRRNIQVKCTLTQAREYYKLVYIYYDTFQQIRCTPVEQIITKKTLFLRFDTYSQVCVTIVEKRVYDLGCAVYDAL